MASRAKKQVKGSGQGSASLPSSAADIAKMSQADLNALSLEELEELQRKIGGGSSQAPLSGQSVTGAFPPRP
jgi:hypothetical protein